ncbi:hypothetical protein SPRG_01711 [Saprolegnia parasitica CBS 223.65]|uniref:Uncharacterized protein n=1 Tax=Saprolegnia parasitica (strain CBS 223.65) TaxID=695850 RepID=A0A067D484_SAPPC|nr:hypothetical protein SPRG_01711 [Saprolegnia parasitica CBS 223.65]KDO33832.1 hypothetical protein SPRG_01711 [Saprolegnia parasitica CBS 223.65]|eukprot:XP_012195468.1 hypothetical protein SPRG_01711 [Saprolegnia parasitica CBS 223.65]
MTSDVDARSSLCYEANAFIYLLPEDVPGGLLSQPVYARVGDSVSHPVTTIPCEGSHAALSLPALSLGHVVSEDEALVAKTGLWYRHSVVVAVNDSEVCHGQVIAYDVPTRKLTVRTSTGLFTVHQRNVQRAPEICALLLWPFSYSSAQKLTVDVHSRLLMTLASESCPDLPDLVRDLVEGGSDEASTDEMLPQPHDIRLWLDLGSGVDRLTTLSHAIHYYKHAMLRLRVDVAIGTSICDDPSLRHKTAAPPPFHQRLSFWRALLAVAVLGGISYVIFYIVTGRFHVRDMWR